jgi:hypothetical protein
MFDHIGTSYRKNGALIDTNLFLLLLVGRTDPTKLGTFRATQKYNARIYSLLEALVSIFFQIYITPNIVTEVDNLSRQVSKAEWPRISSALRRILTTMSEQSFPSLELVSHRFHQQFGVADCSVFEMSNRGVLVIADDLRLTVLLEQNRRGVINLNRYLLDYRRQ